MPDTATEVMIGSLDQLQAMANPLIVDEASGQLAAALRERGASPSEWRRMAGMDQAVAARAWPIPAPADAALLRLPKSKAAFEFALHAVAALVEPGGLIGVFGNTDEGIKSADRGLSDVAEEVTTVRIKQRARVLVGRRRSHIEGLRPHLEDWRSMDSLQLDVARRPWVTYPGVFGGGSLDAGTQFLLAHLPEVPGGASVLDFAAGGGAIGAAIAERRPDANITLLDADAVAMKAATENVRRANVIVGDSLEATGDARFGMIVSNPPIHAGVREDHNVLLRLIEEAPAHLVVGGMLAIVVQRRVAVARAIEAAFGNVEILADDGRFTVLAARWSAPPPKKRRVAS